MRLICVWGGRGSTGGQAGIGGGRWAKGEAFDTCAMPSCSQHHKAGRDQDRLSLPFPRSGPQEAFGTPKNVCLPYVERPEASACIEDASRALVSVCSFDDKSR